VWIAGFTEDQQSNQLSGHSRLRKIFPIHANKTHHFI
jgi:hypothetical protein